MKKGTAKYMNDDSEDVRHIEADALIWPFYMIIYFHSETPGKYWMSLDQGATWKEVGKLRLRYHIIKGHFVSWFTRLRYRL